MDHLFLLITGSCLLVLSLLLFIYVRLLRTRPVAVTIKSHSTVQVKYGHTVLRAVTEAGLQIPSFCEGKGRCGQCRCIVVPDSGKPTKNERNRFTHNELQSGMRLACQVNVKRALTVSLSSQCLAAKQYICEIESNINLTTVIKELVVKLPDINDFSCQPGQFMLFEVPPHQLHYEALSIDPEFKEEWSRLNMSRFHSRAPYKQNCAYSITHWDEKNGTLSFVTRVLQPKDLGIRSNTGQLLPQFISQPSAYLFNLVKEENIFISGPFGEFGANMGEDALVLIGSGTGIAPLFSHIIQLLEVKGSNQSISLWHECQSKNDTLYSKQLKLLSEKFSNFSYHLVFSYLQNSEQLEGDEEKVADFLYEYYCKESKSFIGADYYICGSLRMVVSVYKMLLDQGVDNGEIHFDEQPVSRSVMLDLQFDSVNKGEV